MSSYLSDDEQVEALKRWWKDNGTSVIVGAILGFGIIFGWQGWNAYQTTQGEAASMLYSNMENQLSAGDTDAGMQTAKRLVGEFGDSVYATFAAMRLARVSYEQGEKAAAQSHLQWAMSNAPDPALQDLARLRLARLMLDTEQWDAAQQLIDQAGSLMPGEFEVLRGDLARQQGDLQQARSAYQAALLKQVDDPALVRMKLVELGDPGAAS